MGLPTLLLAYAAGIGIAPFFPIHPAVYVTPLIIIPVWICVRHIWPAKILLAVFFVLLGFSLYHLRIAPPTSPGHVSAFAGDREITLAGEIVEIAARPQNHSVLDLEARRMVHAGIAAPVHGRVRLYIDRGFPAARPGDFVRFRTHLRPTHAFGTPGEFDYPRFLAQKGIFVTAFLPDADDLAVVQMVAKPGFAAAMQRHRQTLSRFIDKHLPVDQAPLVRALVLGDKQGISPDQRMLLSSGGVAHLFAISGLHLGLIAVFLYYTGRALYRRCDPLLLIGPPRRHLPPLLLPLLWSYLLLTGAALSTFRAFLMVLAGALLFLSNRRTPPLKLLAATAFLILCFDPLALFTPSFQLSFAGVFGILILLPRWQKQIVDMPGPLRMVANLFGATLAATIATTPLVLWHFHLIAPAGLLINLAAVPAIGFLAVPLGLCGVLIHPIDTAMAATLFQGCALITEGVLQLVEAIVALPPLAGWRFYASPMQHGGIALCAVTLLLPAKTLFHRTAKIAGFALAAMLFFLPQSTSTLTVTALSVGQGDAILVSRAQDAHYLIDGGGLYGDTFDVGERLVAPALGHLGVDRLEAVVLTHDDPDHRKGLVHILEHFTVNEFWAPAPLETLHYSLQEVLRRQKIPVRQYPPGWTVLQDNGEDSLAVFSPPLPNGSDNNRSLVLYIRKGVDGVLLTGDLEDAGVRTLESALPPGPVTLLKLPHHGSRYSSPGLLFDRLSPRLTFVSAGRDNRYGLPHKEVVQELRRRSIPLHRTDLFGTLRFRVTAEGWETKKWQRGLFR